MEILPNPAGTRTLASRLELCATTKLNRTHISETTCIPLSWMQEQHWDPTIHCHPFVVWNELLEMENWDLEPKQNQAQYKALLNNL